MPLPSITFRPAELAEPAVAETILPPRTMMVPDSMTGPVTVMMRVLVIATSCATSSEQKHARPRLAINVKQRIAGSRFIIVSSIRPQRYELQGTLKERWARGSRSPCGSRSLLCAVIQASAIPPPCSPTLALRRPPVALVALGPRLGEVHTQCARSCIVYGRHPASGLQDATQRNH